MTLSPGDQFGPYRLEERLGAGGLAEVWRAVEISSGRVVALKRFSGALASADAERLRADVELLAANAVGGNPHVVAVYGGGPEPEPHVVMEYMDGGDLSDELAQGRLTLARTLEIGQAVASALAAAADAGIVHGDLKPSNILLGSDGAIKLSDFNVARVVDYSGASMSATILLSVPYAAPEVWDGTASSSSDLYALGCVLYECLTGSPPFNGTYTQVIRAHIDKAPDLSKLPQDTPSELREMVAQLLAKDPVARPTAPQVGQRLIAIRAEIDAHAGEQLPTSMGPWQIESAHPAQPLAWRARHKDSGQLATVEVRVGRKELGDSLRAAVAANEQLVPLGAERLLGFNRLLLHPGEGIGPPVPKGDWIYWVAREELALPPAVDPLNADALLAAAGSITTLLAAATAAGIALDLSPANVSVLPDGSIHVRRPGLPGPGTAQPEQTALATLKGLAAPGVLSAIAGADSLTELESHLARGSASTELHEQPADTAELPRFEPTVRLPKLKAVQPPSPPAPPPAPINSASGGSNRRALAALPIALVGVLVLALVAYGAFGFGAPIPPATTAPTSAPTLIANVTPLPSIDATASATSVTPTASLPATTPSPAASATRVPTPSPIPAGTVLYDAASAQWTGWDTVDSWRIAGNMLVNDGTDNSDPSLDMVVAPWELSTSDAVVEADIQFTRDGGFPDPGTYDKVDDISFGMVVRMDATGSYTAGYADIGGGWCDGEAKIAAIWPTTAHWSDCHKFDDIVGRHNFAVDHGWHSFKLEMVGNQLTLSIDGRVYVDTTDNRFISGTSIGLWARNAQVNVRSFRVLVP